MKALLVEYGKGHHPQAIREVRKTKVHNCYAERYFWWPKTSSFSACYLVAVYLAIFVSSQKYILTSSVGLHFIRRTILNEAMKSLCAKWREHPVCHGLDKSSGRWVFYPTSQTNDHEPCPVKHFKLFKSHHPVEMNEPEFLFYFTNKHQLNPGDKIWYKKSLREEWSRKDTFESCSKQFCLQNLYLKVTRFRRTCGCVPRVSGYQNVRSVEIYTNQQLFKFIEKCRLHLVA